MCFYIPTDEKEMTATEDITCYKMGRRSHSDGFVSSIQEYEYGDNEWKIDLVPLYHFYDDEKKPESILMTKKEFLELKKFLSGLKLKKNTIKPRSIRSAYCKCKPRGRFNSVGVCVICKNEYRP